VEKIEKGIFWKESLEKALMDAKNDQPFG
jgi:hypothetical protein